MLNRYNTFFPVWAVLLSLVAYVLPEVVSGFRFTIVPLLSLVMFFMGSTLIQVKMDGKGRQLDNVFIERLWCSVKYEEVYLKAYENPNEAG